MSGEPTIYSSFSVEIFPKEHRNQILSEKDVSLLPSESFSSQSEQGGQDILIYIIRDWNHTDWFID